jgi:hypothetical protein
MERFTWLGEENECIRQIRDEELRNPAPFSSKQLFEVDHQGATTQHPGLQYDPLACPEYFVADVPIRRIVAISTGNNMEPFKNGMSFRQVLFGCLHGHSLIPASLDYFLSDCLKSDKHTTHADYCEYPQSNAVDSSLKGFGRGGIGLTQRGEYLYVDQGQQRTLLAMFWIYQNVGEDGLLKGVRVLGDTRSGKWLKPRLVSC